MIFSYKELRRLANLDNNTKLDDVLKAINSIGFEVEDTEVFGDVDGLKFGKVINISMNPNADKLHVCEIEFNDKNRIIQTNADNVFVGMYVVAFVPGSRSGKVIFDSKELKGVTSDGMLSSLNEFGISKDLLREGASDGIQGYDGVSLDMDPIEYLGLNDTLIDIDILSNRSDAQSYYVMAREIAAYFGTNPLNIGVKNPQFKSDLFVDAGKHIELSLIESKNDFEITIGEQILLAKSGIKSISNIVDLTNLSLIMTGQPTHAYDKNSVGKEFSSSLSSKSVKIFGGKEIILDNDLVITSDKVDVSLAGVIGFENTGVLSTTNDFVIELGRFNIKDVRKSLKTIKMTTSAGIQSSKIIGKGTTELAIKYLSSKLSTFSETVNFEIAKDKYIDFSTVKLSRLVGFDITKEKQYEKAIASLEILGFVFSKNKVMVPSYRYDVITQQDLSEEVLRFYGYDNLPLNPPKISPYKVSIKFDQKVQIAAMGYNEIYTYSLISKEDDIFNPFNFDKTISLETYVSKKREVIRNSQLISLLEVISYNSKRNIDSLNIFSEGMINDGIKSIALASTTKSFIQMKNDLVKLLPSNILFKATVDNKMHPGVSADIMLDGNKIGFIGKVNPKVINNNAFIAEFLILPTKSSAFYKSYSKDPLKSIDITFELKLRENIDFKIGKMDIFEVKVIDEFKKGDVNKVTVRFTGTVEQINIIDQKYNK